ncbi:MAG: hypothetical protein LBL65_07155 [Campylobacteraceae bacterium]|nr:hypothetical protein [Campylobacteraceae bacterium]
MKFWYRTAFWQIAYEVSLLPISGKICLNDTTKEYILFRHCEEYEI